MGSALTDLRGQENHDISSALRPFSERGPSTKRQPEAICAKMGDLRFTAVVNPNYGMGIVEESIKDNERLDETVSSL